MAFKPGDKVYSPHYSSTVWAGEMTVDQTYSNGMVSCIHPTAGSGAFPPDQLVLVAPAADAAKVSIKDAIALLQAEGYTVSAPYWESKSVRTTDCQGNELQVIAYVDKDTVQVGTGTTKIWVGFTDWDAITKVVEEAKEFRRKYRS